MTAPAEGAPHPAPAAEVIAVGAELLLGDVADTNSAHISGRLAEIGVEVRRHTAVGDEVGMIAEVLEGAIRRAQVVVVTGGLGPTQDDLTRVALARVAGVELVRDPALVDELAAHFARHDRDMAPSNLQQADLPEGGRWLPRVGTAAGIVMDLGDTAVFCLPGVPREMREMLDRDVLPDVRRRVDQATTVTRSVRTAGLGESQMADRLAALIDRVESEGGPTIAFLAGGGEARVKVTARAATRAAALALVAPVVEEIIALLGRGVVGLDDEGVEHAVGRLLTEAGLTMAVAESITGGGVGARLVRVAGASTWFAGGLITYATPSKTALAGVDTDLLAHEGPVSGPVADALAVGAAERLGADVGLSVVGVAGPDTQGGQPVGTVWVGVVGPDGWPRSRQIELAGDDRIELQQIAVQTALTVLHRALVRLTT